LVLALGLELAQVLGLALALEAQELVLELALVLEAQESVLELALALGAQELVWAVVLEVVHLLQDQILAYEL
jgi:hypothetical protein